MAEKHQDTKTLLFTQRNSIQKPTSCMKLISETTGTHDGSRTHYLLSIFRQCAYRCATRVNGTYHPLYGSVSDLAAKDFNLHCYV
jgi:hypothetical protein